MSDVAKFIVMILVTCACAIATLWLLDKPFFSKPRALNLNPIFFSAFAAVTFSVFWVAYTLIATAIFF